ncbi:MAG: NUDIX hydrolase [Lachnospiraceae bacterium]|nr:NUDIX hydrolase [Lachnospiraceae bacterium]
MKRDHLTWELVREKKLVDNEWIDFRESEWRFPDGMELGPFYTYHRKDYAVIVAVDEEGRFLCVRQFRQGIRRVTTEFPAGGIEAGEDPLDAAGRELREETGYVSDDWTFLAKIPSNATMADNYAYLYLARGCRKEAQTHLDVTEFVETQLKKRQELEEMISSGSFEQAVHVAAYYMAMERC